MEQQTFFEQDAAAPLAARLRPRTLDEIVGQRHLLGEGKVLRRLIEDDHISSMIFCTRSRVSMRFPLRWTTTRVPLTSNRSSTAYTSVWL